MFPALNIVGGVHCGSLLHQHQCCHLFLLCFAEFVACSCIALQVRAATGAMRLQPVVHVVFVACRLEKGLSGDALQLWKTSTAVSHAIDAWEAAVPGGLALLEV